MYKESKGVAVIYPPNYKHNNTESVIDVRRGNILDSQEKRKSEYYRFLCDKVVNAYINQLSSIGMNAIPYTENGELKFKNTPCEIRARKQILENLEEYKTCNYPLLFPSNKTS